METHQPSNAIKGFGSSEYHRLVVRNLISELRRVSGWVHNLGVASGLTRERVHVLELSVYEALSNIISYAYRDDTPHEIVIELFVQPDRIRVEIEDDGVPFNPLGLILEEPPESLEESRPSGRGIPLMRKLMDELDYVRRGNANVLTMVMRHAQT